MSWFKRKAAAEIPAVEPEAPSPSSRYASSASTYVASRDGDKYEDSYSSRSEAPRTVEPERYGRNNSVGDPYSRRGGAVDDDRNELFSGYNPQKGGSGRFFDGPPSGREPTPGEENDEDVEGIKKQTRYVKQESANSTRNALRLAREAEDTARNTLGRLGDQSERLANTEMHLDVAKGHSSRANDMTDELKQLNRSIFRPVITFNKDAKRAAQASRVQSRYDEERHERERAMMDVRETQNRLGQAQTYGREGSGDEELLGNGGGRRRYRTEEQLQSRKTARGKYQFEGTASDDEVEDEIDDNLDEISDVSKRLKALGMAMGQELDSQNRRLDTISNKTDGLDLKLAGVTARQKKF
ncbi:protein transporter SEC9 [Mycena floridula]|nr:protein transporter SEC9 [Mycena floridula]